MATPKEKWMEDLRKAREDLRAVQENARQDMDQAGRDLQDLLREQPWAALAAAALAGLILALLAGR